MISAPLKLISSCISVSVDKDIVVVRGDPPVLTVVILLGEVFLMIGEEPVQLDALLEVLSRLEASNILEEIKVAVCVDARLDHSVPVDALQLDVGVVLLEVEVERAAKPDVWTFDGVHVFTSHLELVEVEVLGEYLHYQ